MARAVGPTAFDPEFLKQQITSPGFLEGVKRATPAEDVIPLPDTEEPTPEIPTERPGYIEETIYEGYEDIPQREDTPGRIDRVVVEEPTEGRAKSQEQETGQDTIMSANFPYITKDTERAFQQAIQNKMPDASPMERYEMGRKLIEKKFSEQKNQREIKEGIVEGPKPGFFDRAVGAVTGRIEKIAEGAKRFEEKRAKAVEEEGFIGGLKIVPQLPREGLQILGNVAGAAADLIGVGIEQLTPDVAEEYVAEKGIGLWRSFAEKNPKSAEAVIGAVRGGSEGYDKFAKDNPETAETVESIFNITGVLGVGQAKKQGAKLAKDLTEWGKTQAGKLPTLGRKKVPLVDIKTPKDVLKSKEAGGIWEKIAPKLTSKERKLKSAKGLEVQKGFLKKTGYLPDKKELALIRVADELPLGKNRIDNQNIVIKEIADEAANLVKVAEDTPFIFNKKQLRGRLNKIETPIAIKTDKQLKTAYDMVKDNFIKIMDEQTKNASGLLQGRKQFDSWVQKQFGDIYATDRWSPMKGAIKDIRREANNYLNERIGDDIVKASLKRQSELYDILENMASHADKAGEYHGTLGKLRETVTSRAGTFVGGGVAF